MATSRPPVFFFQVLGMQEAPNRLSNIDASGNWSPPKSLYSNVLNNEASPCYYCNGTSITPTPLPPEAQHFKTMSVYHSRERFYIVPYDATRHPVGDGIDRNGPILQTLPTGYATACYGTWQDIHFEWNETNYSSLVTYAEEHTRLRTQRPDQAWARMLFPLGYHAEPSNWTSITSYGGLNGDLPLIIALLAFSVRRERLEWYFHTHYDGMFRSHQRHHGREERRGVVVHVWSWPPHSDRAYLEQFESGGWGHLFP